MFERSEMSVYFRFEHVKITKLIIYTTTLQYNISNFYISIYIDYQGKAE